MYPHPPQIEVGSEIPPNKHVTPKNEKLDLGILLFATFGKTIRVRVGHFSMPSNHECDTQK